MEKTNFVITYSPAKIIIIEATGKKEARQKANKILGVMGNITSIDILRSKPFKFKPRNRTYKN
ncbi:MAG: hypothetical protein WC389_14970 [Lutibacter sp.]|jgi:hypothetical protein